MARLVPAASRMLVALLLAPAAPAQSVPTLKFQEPFGFLSAGGRDPLTYASINNTETVIRIYEFRPISGDLRQQFRQTLLRDWLDPSFREEKYHEGPLFNEPQIPGADAALLAGFRELRSGRVREHVRLLILAGGSAAMVDMRADDPQAWQRSADFIRGFLVSLRVETAQPQVAQREAPTPRATPGARGGLPGLYLGLQREFRLNPLGSPGSGDWAVVTRYYLLSENGRVHRGLQLPDAPGGDIRRFDYDLWQQREPGNAGVYTVQGGRVIITISPRESPETIAAEITAKGLKIRGTEYEKAALKYP